MFVVVQSLTALDGAETIRGIGPFDSRAEAVAYIASAEVPSEVDAGFVESLCVAEVTPPAAG